MKYEMTYLNDLSDEGKNVIIFHHFYQKRKQDFPARAQG